MVARGEGRGGGVNLVISGNPEIKFIADRNLDFTADVCQKAQGVPHDD